MIRTILKTHNIKATIPRIEILSIIKDNKEITIKEICNKLSNIDPSTIYRTIELFLNKNIIDMLIVDKKIKYVLKDEHKHYLNCIKCHKRIELNTCPFNCEEINGFKILNHSLSIDGICNLCQK